MLRTALCERLQISHPILSVGMGTAAGPELVAAVSGAGACGVLGTAGLPGHHVRDRIKQVRERTQAPFGVNVILAIRRGQTRMAEEQIQASLEERVPLLVLFWGDAAPYVERAQKGGALLFVQVGSVAEARAAAAAGVDGIIAQGVEAGGHVKGTTALSTFLPSVVDAVRPLPVLAAGGIATGRGIAAALKLGAQGVSIGTRFLATEEAFVPHEYKERLVKSGAEDTVYCGLFDVGWPDAPHRVLRNTIVAAWEAAGRPPHGERLGEGSVVGVDERAGARVEVPKYGSWMVSPNFTGDLDSVPLWAGQSCSLVHDIQPAAAVVGNLVREAEETLSSAPR